MFDIWNFTTFWTTNLAHKFLDINSIQDIDPFIKSLPKNTDFFCFWWWSNLLFSQEEYHDTLFVRNRIGWITQISSEKYLVWAWEFLWHLINYFDSKWVNSLNPMFWLPWTLWWAVIWNAWSYWAEIWQFVSGVKFIDEKWEFVSDYKYSSSYRNSNLKGKKLFLLEVELYVPNNLNSEILDKKNYLEKRIATQEYKNTCWSYFKNPKIHKSDQNYEKVFDKLLKNDEKLFGPQSAKEEISVPAWWLIEKIWMKWVEYNWVRISNKHANFFVNYANKNSQNILDLADNVKSKVFAEFWIMLEEEVIII